MLGKPVVFNGGYRIFSVVRSEKFAAFITCGTKCIAAVSSDNLFAARSTAKRLYAFQVYLTGGKLKIPQVKIRIIVMREYNGTKETAVVCCFYGIHYRTHGTALQSRIMAKR